VWLGSGASFAPPPASTSTSKFSNGLSLALARSFKIIDPELKNPDTEHWERAFRLFDLLI
jgi:hypothetical protein